MKDNLIKITAQESSMHLLPDNTKVWMEPGSSISYAKSFVQDRRVWLEGNSLFEVSKHEGSTFQVHITNAYVEVKGTCFLIKQNSSGHNEITLINGSIDFNIENGKKNIPLKPMQRVIYNPLEGETEIKEMANIKWEDGKYLFNDMSLTQLIQTINQLYSTQIILTKDVNRKSAFTGTIRYDEPLANVLNKICFSLNLNKEQVNNQIIIY
nr:FecR family protein [uncultured Bacteroides sp.]